MCECVSEFKHLERKLDKQGGDIEKLEENTKNIEIQMARLAEQVAISRKFFYAAVVPGCVAMLGVVSTWLAK